MGSREGVEPEVGGGGVGRGEVGVPLDMVTAYVPPVTVSGRPDGRVNCGKCWCRVVCGLTFTVPEKSCAQGDGSGGAPATHQLRYRKQVPPR